MHTRGNVSASRCFFFFLITGEKYEASFSDNAYKMHMKLIIRSVAMSDYGSYKCISKNSLGETDGSIKLYREYNTFLHPIIEKLLLFDYRRGTSRIGKRVHILVC